MNKREYTAQGGGCGESACSIYHRVPERFPLVNAASSLTERVAGVTVTPSPKTPLMNLSFESSTLYEL